MLGTRPAGGNCQHAQTWLQGGMRSLPQIGQAAAPAAVRGPQNQRFKPPPSRRATARGAAAAEAAAASDAEPGRQAAAHLVLVAPRSPRQAGRRAEARQPAADLGRDAAARLVLVHVHGRGRAEALGHAAPRLVEVHLLAADEDGGRRQAPLAGRPRELPLELLGEAAPRLVDVGLGPEGLLLRRGVPAEVVPRGHRRAAFADLLLELQHEGILGGECGSRCERHGAVRGSCAGRAKGRS
mmetsp:Transcript_48765/g.130514  ORF Transcript_48765/g.130514 Transcript_48765/m.130514 type:complete len:240 (-) Transcript_48765:54-773(-)